MFPRRVFGGRAWRNSVRECVRCGPRFCRALVALPLSGFVSACASPSRKSRDAQTVFVRPPPPVPSGTAAAASSPPADLPRLVWGAFYGWKDASTQVEIEVEDDRRGVWWRHAQWQLTGRFRPTREGLELVYEGGDGDIIGPDAFLLGIVLLTVRVDSVAPEGHVDTVRVTFAAPLEPTIAAATVFLAIRVTLRARGRAPRCARRIRRSRPRRY